MSISQRILNNTVVGLLAKFLEVAVAFLTIPILLSSLGKENYGFWIMCSQVLVFFGALDFGVTSSIGRFVAKYNARADKDGLINNINTSLFLLFISAILVLISTLIVVFKYTTFFNVAPVHVNTGIYIVLILGIGIAIDFVLRIGRGILAGIHNFDLIYIVNIIKLLYRFALIFYIYHTVKSKSIIFISLISISAILLSDLLMCFIARKKMASFNLNLKNITRSSIKEVLSLGAANLLSGIIVTFTKSLTLILIANRLTLNDVTLYSIPVSLIVYLSMIVSTFVVSFTTLASEAHELKKEDQKIRLNIFGVRYATTACLGFGLLAVFFGRYFFPIWFQGSLSKGSLSIRDCSVISVVLNLLVIGFIFDRGQAPTAKMLLGTGSQWLSLLISAGKNILGLLLGYTFMTFTSFGILGMAIGWLTSYSVAGIFIYPYIACWCFKINLFKYFFYVYLRPILASLPLALLSYALSQYFKPSSWLMLTTITALCAGIYCVLVYFICIEKEHRVLLVKHIKGGLFSHLKTETMSLIQ